MPPTDARPDGAADRGAAEEQSGFPRAEGAYPDLIWKRGVEVPPFSLANAAAVELVSSILAGTVGELPRVVVSEAVAIQIYRMCTAGDARSGVMLR